MSTFRDNSDKPMGKMTFRLREEVQRSTKSVLPHGVQCPCPACQAVAQAQADKARQEGANSVIAAMVGIVLFLLLVLLALAGR